MSGLAHWIAVAGGCGYVPIAPGTAGSAAGALLFLITFGWATGASWAVERAGLAGTASVGVRSSALPPMGLALFFLALVLALTVIGVWSAGVAERRFDRKDDGRIVIDEVVGQLIALTPLLIFLGPTASFSSVIVGVVTGFVLFRLFDVWKPGAIRWAERRFEGGLGVMADDLIAGVYAAGTLSVLIGGFLMFSGGLTSLSGGLSTFGGGLS